jgi:hypothetical protein
MDAAAHYRHLLSLGRGEFLAAAAPAVLVRRRTSETGEPSERSPAATATRTLTIDEDQVGDTIDEAMSHGELAARADEIELYPLAKKPGASFPDRITIGRTPNNDVVIAEHSVSRLHAYVRLDDGARPTGLGAWVIADAGSKNGSWLDEVPLAPRREARLPPGGVLRLGDVVATFYRSADLFDLLGDDDGRR